MKFAFLKIMPRAPRTLPDEGMIHLIGRGNNGMHLFQNADDFTQFRKTILRFIGETNLPIHIHNYVFMHTHFHLLAWIDNTKQLASFMKAVAVSYNHYYQRKYKYRGHIWHSRFRSIVIFNESHWFACGRYIELNPIRAGICNKPWKYEWSSYHHYAYGKDDPLLDPIEGNPAMFDWAKNKGSRDYRKFVLEGLKMDQHEMKKQYSAK